MSTLHDFHNMNDVDDLAQLMEQLANDIDRLRAAGCLNVRESQQAAHSLFRLQFLLNDLERTVVQERGASREIAERFLDLESRIRAMHGVLSVMKTP